MDDVLAILFILMLGFLLGYGARGAAAPRSCKSLRRTIAKAVIAARANNEASS